MGRSPVDQPDPVAYTAAVQGVAAGVILVLGSNIDAGLWAEDHPVLEVLRARRADGSTPGNRRDGYRVGVAVEGGAMRGIVSAAMLAALEDLGYKPAFDRVYACSSGAFNAAFFVQGDCWYPLTIYHDDLRTPEFIDFRRALMGRAILDLDWVFDVVLERVKPLDYDAVLDSPLPLHVAITLVDEMRAIAPCDFRSREDLRDALRASAWLPLATRGTAAFRGARAIDGGVLVAHPVRFAMQECTHVLSLSTRPTTPPRTRLTPMQLMAARLLDRMRSDLGAAYLAGARAYREERAYLIRCRTEPDAEPSVLDLSPPPGTPEIARHERRAAVLMEGARIAYETMVRALERRVTRVVPRLALPPDPWM